LSSQFTLGSFSAGAAAAVHSRPRGAGCFEQKKIEIGVTACNTHTRQPTRQASTIKELLNMNNNRLSFLLSPSEHTVKPGQQSSPC